MCIFCKLANKEIDTEVVYEDEDIFVFKDSDPKAPIHLLFIPKKHIESINDLTDENALIVSKIFLKIRDIAKEMGFSENGYRVVANTGEDGGQSVKHLHFHVLAGRVMTWPAG